MKSVPFDFRFVLTALLARVSQQGSWSFTFKELGPFWKGALQSRSSYSLGEEETTYSMLRSKYFDRLGFSENEVDVLAKPSKEILDKIMERHLKTINFENLSQHGLPHPPQLDADAIVKKLVDGKRGGFCYEQNGLLAEVLLELGYNVKRIPAIVHTPDLEFDHLASHMVLVVSIPGQDDTEWLADVGFGEPAINSLKYELDTVQETPEGMISRLVRSEDADSVILEWKPNGEIESQWSPRLKWNFRHPGQPLEDFQSGLDEVLKDSSMFAKKTITVWIDREQKVSLAGFRLKRTKPRFGSEKGVTTTQLDSDEEVRRVLRDEFSVPDTDKLDLSKSREADRETWNQF